MLTVTLAPIKIIKVNSLYRHLGESIRQDNSVLTNMFAFLIVGHAIWSTHCQNSRRQAEAEKWPNKKKKVKTYKQAGR